MLNKDPKIITDNGQNKPSKDELDTQTPIETRCTFTEQVEAIPEAKNIFDNLQEVDESVEVVEEPVIPAVKPKTRKVTKTKSVITKSILGQVANPINNFFINEEAKVFEEYSMEALDKLTALISKEGLLQPITVWWNKTEKRWEVVDGRHRLEACNRLGIKVKLNPLPKSTKQDDLPEKVLALQLSNRNLDKIVVNCEAVIYLERGRLSAKELAEQYPDFDGELTSRLKTIRRVRPLWFKTLRLKEGVVIEKGDRPSRAVRKLADICVKEEKEALGTGTKKPKETAQEMAIVYEKVKPLVNMVISTLGEDLYLNDAYELLFKQKSKYSSDKYGTPVQVQRITSLEEQIDLLTEDLATKDGQLKSNKAELSEARQNIALRDELFEDIKRELPKTPKTRKMMMKINKKFTDSKRG